MIGWPVGVYESRHLTLNHWAYSDPITQRSDYTLHLQRGRWFMEAGMKRSRSMIDPLAAGGGPIRSIALAMALLAFASIPSLSQSAAFAGFAGSWTGSGTIALS